MAITVEARTEIISLVVGMFGAAPGASVLSDLVAAYEAGSSVAQIGANLAGTAEFKSIYPTFLTNGEYATKIVNNLLGEASAEAKAEAVTVLTAELNGGMTRTAAMVAAINFVASTASTNTAYGSSAAAFDNKVSAATYYSVDAQNSGSSLAELQNVISSVTSDAATVTAANNKSDGTATEGDTFTLTKSTVTGQADNITGTLGDDTFTAPAGFLEDGVDKLDGNAGNDTLDATISASIAPSLKNIETAKVQATANADFNLSNTSGVTSIVASNTTDNVTLTVKGVSASQSLSMVGGKGSLTLDAASSTKASATRTITLNGVENGTATALTDSLDTNITLVTTGAASSLDDIVSTTATALTVNADEKLTSKLTISAAKSITVSGDSLVTGSAGSDFTALETVTVTGSGGLDIDATTAAALKTVSAAEASGKIEVKGDDTLVTVNTGSGADKVTYTAAIAATAKVNLGAGNDTLTIAAASVKGAAVAGGDGTDTLAVANGAWIDADASDVYSGFEVLEVAGGTGTYDASEISGLTAITATSTALTGAVEVKNLAAGVTVEFKAAASTDTDFVQKFTYTLKTATGTSDSVSVKLHAYDTDTAGADVDGVVTTGELVFADIETVNVNSTVTETDTKSAGDYNNTIDKITAAAATSLVLTGDADLTVTDHDAAVLTKIDASAATGDVTFTNANGTATKAVTYLGGSGVDTFTASAKGDLLVGNAGADKFTLGAGKDTVRYAADGDSVLTLTDANTDGTSDGTKGYDVITSFTSGTDKIELSSGLGLGTGDARTAFVNKGTLAADGDADTDAEIAGKLQTLIGTGADLFNDGATDRALAVVSYDDTTAAEDFVLVFVDVNNDGNFTLGTDGMIKLAGITSIVISDVVFG